MRIGLKNNGVLVTAPWIACAAVILGLSIMPCYAGGYGALAYDASNGATGWSQDHPSQASANTAALQSCAQYGRHCQVVAEVPGGCGAYAAGADSAAGRLSGTLAAAQRAALNYCNIYGGLGDCVVKVSVCNSPPRGWIDLAPTLSSKARLDA
jgi:hypothetical protein